MERDVPNAEYHDFAKIQEGGICPKCGKKTVKISRGIEVGISSSLEPNIQNP